MWFAILFFTWQPALSLESEKKTKNKKQKKQKKTTKKQHFQEI